MRALVRLSSWAALLLAASAKKLEFAIVGLPYSPLHSIVVTGQELCLRGHSVTVLSFAEKGRQKTAKYAPACALKYVSLGELPVPEEEEKAIFRRVEQMQNNSMAVVKEVMVKLGAKFASALVEPLQEVLRSGAVKPDFALISVPFGSVATVLRKAGVPFAINVPTVMLPPLVPYTAGYVPFPLYDVSPGEMGFLDRSFVLGFNGVLSVAKQLASSAGLRPVDDLDPSNWWGRLVLVNSVPGFDYPQPLPPLVQFTGPVLDLGKMEPFPPEVEAFLEGTPESMPVLYVSFGTMVFLSPERVAAAVRALTSSKFRVLWALPKVQQEGLPRPLPSGFMVHHWVPTPRALAHPRVKAFLSHCGGNSAMESMSFGVPVVGYPQFGDQLAVCRRIADAGAGRTRPVGNWVQAGDAEEVLASEAMAQRAATMSRLVRAFGGASRAADLLELAAAGDLEILTPFNERSWTAAFRLGGHETTLVSLLLLQMLLWLCCGCCRRCCCRSRPAGGKAKQQ